MYKRTGAPVSHAEVAEAVEATIERWVREAPAVLDAIAASDRHRLLVEKPDWATAKAALLSLAREFDDEDDGCVTADGGEGHGRARASTVLTPEKREELLSKKRSALQEILTYVESQSDKLNGLVEIYLRPLNDASFRSGGEILGLDKITKIFSNIEDIAMINEALYKQLDERIRVDGSDRVGDIFLNMSFALKLYSRYISNFDTSRECITESIENSKGFASWLQELEDDPETARRFKNNRLQSILMTPVNQIPRFELLLRELHKYQSKLGETQWMEELERCMDVVHEVAVYNNDCIRQHESKAAMYELELRFKADARPQPPLAGAGQPLRELVREGAMHKIDQHGNHTRDIVLMLLTDSILYTTRDPIMGKLVWVRTINLADGATQLIRAPSAAYGEGALEIKNAIKSMVVKLDSVGERDTWLKTISAAQSAERERKTGGVVRDESISKPLLDRDGPRCSLCTSQFTTTNRRHYCGVNGELVCNMCSKSYCDLNRELGGNFGKYERVCDMCMRDKSIFGSWRGVIKHRVHRDDVAPPPPKPSRAGGVATARLEPLSESGRYRGTLSAHVLKAPSNTLAGFLWKKGHTKKAGATHHLFSSRSWKKRWFVLHPDTFAYYEKAADAEAEASPDDVSLRDMLSLSGQRLGEVLLNHAAIKDVCPEQCTFVISSPQRDLPICTTEAEHECTITPLDRENFTLWVETITARIAQANGVTTAAIELWVES